jgi:hypothetical protein
VRGRAASKSTRGKEIERAAGDDDDDDDDGNDDDGGGDAADTETEGPLVMKTPR